MRERSKAKLGAENAARLEAYIAQHEAAGTLPMSGGRLNKSRIAEHLGFGRSVFGQNPACKRLIGALEARLPSVRAASPQPALSSRRRNELEQRITRLETRVATLAAENQDLRRELKERDVRLRELGWSPEAVPETGRLPW